MKSPFIIIPNSTQAVRISDIDNVLLSMKTTHNHYQLEITYIDGQEFCYALPDGQSKQDAEYSFVQFINNINTLQS